MMAMIGGQIESQDNSSSLMDANPTVSAKANPASNRPKIDMILNHFINFIADKLIPEYLNKATTEQILTRLLRNLKNAYTQSYAYDKAMRCTNMILGMRPESSEEIRDKGILQERLLNYDEALPLLNKYLELEPEADDADFILELIKNVREKI